MIKSVYAGKGKSKYEIVITGKNIQNTRLNKYLNKNRKILLVTDNGIPKLHLKKIIGLIDKKKKVFVHTLKKGERSKSISSYKNILHQLIDLKFDRTDCLIALGGGVVGDITGFSAATYLRGIDYIQIPTTLLAQVDSSVGGKTAINTAHGKNLIGSFYNPKFVLISTSFLDTLPLNQFKSGLGEVVKYAFIGNNKLRKIIRDNPKKILSKDEKVLKLIIEESIKTKSQIVTKDEKEQDIRAILNFGHTFGHAIESYSNYKNITHGAAITLGMVIATKVSLLEGHIDQSQMTQVLEILESLELDTDYQKYKYSDLKKYFVSDKKVADGKLNLILIDKNFKAFKTNKFLNKNIQKAIN